MGGRGKTKGAPHYHPTDHSPRAAAWLAPANPASASRPHGQRQETLTSPPSGGRAWRPTCYAEGGGEGPRSKPTTRAGSRESWRWLRLTLARTRKIATPAWRAGAALHLRLQPAGLLANETHFLPFAIRAYAVWQTLYPFWT